MAEQATIRVKMQGLAVGGACIGEVIDGPAALRGVKAFVPLTLPGELVEARIVERHDRFIQAELLSILESSSDRVAPPCPYYGVCGGCDLQHMNLPAQREAKRQMVEHMLSRQGQIRPREGVTLLGGELPGDRYRTRIGLHVDRSGKLGFYRRGSGAVVDVESCLITSPEVERKYRTLRPALAGAAALVGGVTFDQLDESGTVQVVVDLRDEAHGVRQPLTIPELRALQQQEPSIRIRHRERDLLPLADTLQKSAGHFSQVNRFGNSILTNVVTASVSSGDVSELYAGAGNFSLPLAQQGCTVEAVEIDPTLVECGIERAQALGLGTKVQFFTMSCEQFLRVRTPKPTVVLDPPRSGAKEIVQRFDRGLVSTIIYVSCNLPTLVRDLKTLTARGYTVEGVRLIDMFPQTHHVETVTVIRG